MAQPVARPLEDRARLGIVMMLAAWLLLSLVDTSVKWLVIAGIPVLQLAFMRYFVHFLIATAARGVGAGMNCSPARMGSPRPTR